MKSLASDSRARRCVSGCPRPAFGSTFDCTQSTKRHFAKHGKLVASCSDQHSVFRANRKEAAGRTGLTRFGRALTDVNLDIIYADSSQAKGRIERMNQTLQDRLVKELRLKRIDTIDARNECLPAYLGIIDTKQPICTDRSPNSTNSSSRCAGRNSGP